MGQSKPVAWVNFESALIGRGLEGAGKVVVGQLKNINNTSLLVKITYILNKC
jgi:hypothetical protein